MAYTRPHSNKQLRQLTKQLLIGISKSIHIYAYSVQIRDAVYSYGGDPLLIRDCAALVDFFALTQIVSHT